MGMWKLLQRAGMRKWGGLVKVFVISPTQSYTYLLFAYALPQIGVGTSHVLWLWIGVAASLVELWVGLWIGAGVEPWVGLWIGAGVEPWVGPWIGAGVEPWVGLWVGTLHPLSWVPLQSGGRAPHPLSPVPLQSGAVRLTLSLGCHCSPGAVRHILSLRCHGSAGAVCHTLSLGYHCSPGAVRPILSLSGATAVRATPSLSDATAVWGSCTTPSLSSGVIFQLTRDFGFGSMYIVLKFHAMSLLTYQNYTDAYVGTLSVEATQKAFGVSSCNSSSSAAYVTRRLWVSSNAIASKSVEDFYKFTRSSMTLYHIRQAGAVSIECLAFFGLSNRFLQGRVLPWLLLYRSNEGNKPVHVQYSQSKIPV